jgi:hypothetical protein
LSEGVKSGTAVIKAQENKKSQPDLLDDTKLAKVNKGPIQNLGGGEPPVRQYLKMPTLAPE